MSNVVFYMTTCPSTSKMKSDIYRVKALLDAKKVVYKEVRMRAVLLHLQYYTGDVNVIVFGGPKVGGRMGLRPLGGLNADWFGHGS